MTESTVSANVKLVGENGADIMLTVRTGATLEEVQGVLSTLAGALQYAKERYHLSPSQANSNGNGNGHGNGHRCPTHGTPMKQSKHRPNELYCPTKIADSGGGADGSKPIYCKVKVKL